MNTGTRLSVLRMCEVAGFSRVGYYRFLDPEKPAPADMDLRDEMQKIALEWPSYGSRRMTRELKARGWEVNRKAASGSQDVGMKIPHSGGGRTRSQLRKAWIPPGKRSGFEFDRRARQCATKIVLGMGVPARKTWTAGPQNGRHCCSRRALPQQFFGNPFIGDAPIRLEEASWNSQAAQPLGVDAGRHSGSNRAGVGDRRKSRRSLLWARQTVLGFVEQSGTSCDQTGMSIQHLDPWSVAAAITPLRLLVGEARQAPKMTPIGAGQITTITPGQLLADGVGYRWLQRCGADMHPHLEVAGTGLEDHAGGQTIGPHGFDGVGAAVIQVHQDIAGIVIFGVGLKVYITAFPVAHAQEPQGGRMDQLSSGPQPLSGKSSSGPMVNQADQVEIVRHGRHLAAHGLAGQIESAIKHGPNSGIEGIAVTMNPQWTANSGLTGCLSLGVHRSQS